MFNIKKVKEVLDAEFGLEGIIGERNGDVMLVYDMRDLSTEDHSRFVKRYTKLRPSEFTVLPNGPTGYLNYTPNPNAISIQELERRIRASGRATLPELVRMHLKSRLLTFESKKEFTVTIGGKVNDELSKAFTALANANVAVNAYKKDVVKFIPKNFVRDRFDSFRCSD